MFCKNLLEVEAGSALVAQSQKFRKLVLNNAYLRKRHPLFRRIYLNKQISNNLLDIIPYHSNKKGRALLPCLFRQYLTNITNRCTIALVPTDPGGAVAAWGRWGGTAVSSLPSWKGGECQWTRESCRRSRSTSLRGSWSSL